MGTHTYVFLVCVVLEIEIEILESWYHNLI